MVGLIIALNIVKASDLTVADQAEIRYKAELLVHEFESLLNIISNKDITLTETRDLIANSYGNSKNKIFLNADAIIENDINPNHSTFENARDAAVEKYLNDFDLLYVKSEDLSIAFSSLKISGVQQKDYIFVRVYFESLFNSKSKGFDIPYKKTERVAEVRAEKKGSQWEVSIASVVFFNPDKPLVEYAETQDIVQDDVETEHSDTGRVAQNETRTESPQNDISALEARIDSLVKIKTEQLLAEYQNQKADSYNKEIEKAALALKTKDYLAAVRFYAQAGDVSPYEIEPKNKLNEIYEILKIEPFSFEKELYDEAIERGDRAFAIRDYATAKNYYNAALSNQPGNSELKTKIEKLDFFIRTNAELQSKYVAGDYSGAVKDYSDAMKNNKDNPEFFLGRGKCYQKMGNEKKALSDYTDAIELDNHYTEAIETRAQLYVTLEKFPEAIADYSVLISNEPGNSKFYSDRASVKEIIKDLDGAIRDYEAAIRIQPNHLYYFKKGLLQAALKQYDYATISFENSIRLNPHYVQAYYQRGLAYLALNNINATGEDFAKAQLLGLDKESVANIEKITSDYNAKGLSAFASGQYEAAVANFGNAVTIKPSFSEAWFKKGEANYHLRFFENSILDFTQAVMHNPKYYEAYYKRGLAKYRLKDYRNSMDDFTKVIQLKPDYYLAFAGRGDAEFELKQYNQALNDYNKALELNEEQHEVYNQRGLISHISGDYAKAIDDFRDAIKYKEDYAEAHYNRGQSWFALKENSKALADFTKAIELKKDYAMAYHARGKVYQANEKCEDAIADYSQALAYNPDYWESYYQRGICRAETEQYKGALDDYQKAIEMKSDLLNAEVESALGYLYLHLGKYDDAITHFNQGLELSPNDGKMLYGIASCLALQNKTDEALKYFEQSFKTKSVTWADIKSDKAVVKLKKNKDFKKLVDLYLK